MIGEAIGPTGHDASELRRATENLTAEVLAEVDTNAFSRLAQAVLGHSHDDLSALAEADPRVVGSWIAAFSLLKAKAEADARLWSAAVASLSTAASPLLAASKATA